MANFEDKLVGWLVPCLLSGVMAILGWMAINVSKISETLAVAVYQLDNHETRIIRLENHAREHP